MHPAARLQFERMIGEYARWRAVPEKERSPAPAWWWGPAMELRNAPHPLPAEWCAALGLPNQATYAAAAEIFLKALAEQTSMAWPSESTGKSRTKERSILMVSIGNCFISDIDE